MRPRARLAFFFFGAPRGGYFRSGRVQRVSRLEGAERSGAGFINIYFLFFSLNLLPIFYAVPFFLASSAKNPTFVQIWISYLGRPQHFERLAIFCHIFDILIAGISNAGQRIFGPPARSQIVSFSSAFADFVGRPLFRDKKSHFSKKCYFRSETDFGWPSRWGPNR